MTTVTQRDDWVVWVRDPRTRKYTMDGKCYVSEDEAWLALGDRVGYVTLRRTWLREFVRDEAGR